jgi:hypothetical protein
MRVSGGPAPVVSLHRNRCLSALSRSTRFFAQGHVPGAESANLTGIRGFVRRYRNLGKDVRMIQIDVILLVGAVVLIAAIIAARIGARVGLPSLLLFLGLGLVMGESGIGIAFDNADLAQALGFAALVVILAEGGLTTRWSDIRSSAIVAALLATVGVGISVGLMTLFGHYVLGLPIWIAMLLGAVTSPTDAAAIFSVLRTVPIPHGLRGALEALVCSASLCSSCWAAFSSAVVLVGWEHRCCAGSPCLLRGSTHSPSWSGPSSRTELLRSSTPAGLPPSTSAH